MRQPASQSGAATHASGRLDFAARPPSQAWERLASPDGRSSVWAWFKPLHAPHGLILRVPEETYLADPQSNGPPTMRELVDAAGIDPATVGVWYLYGAAYDAASGTTPLLDARIPPPVAGVDPNILVYLNLVGPAAPGVPYFDPTQFVAAAPPQFAAPMPAQSVTAGAGAAVQDLSVAELFDRIETDWYSIVEVERELSRLRKMLVDLFNRLKTLNRDLNSTERMYSNSQDKNDWLDARRWLREGSNRLWRCIKEHDIGDTSTAGQKKWFEQIYQEFVVPRIPFDGLLQAQRDFESYRKLLQTLQNNMSTAHSMASADGERRANQILGRIAAKVRDASTKRNFFGMIVD